MIAQSVEHAAVNRSVVGSSPTQGAKILYLNIMARWLSWLERRPVTAEVVGSSPIRVAFILCRSGGTGRRPGLKIPWVEIPVPVRFRSAAFLFSSNPQKGFELFL